MRIVTLETRARGVVRIGLDAGSFFLLRLAYLEGSGWDGPFLEACRSSQAAVEAVPGLVEALERASSHYAAEKLALAALARREHSRAELENKLSAKKQPLSSIKASLDRLQAEGLLSEDRYVDYFIRSRLRSRPLGAHALKAALRAKGLDRELADKGIKAQEPAICAALERLARDLLEKESRKLEKKALPEKEASWALRRALWSRLLSRGFSSPDIRSVLSRIAGEERNLDEPDDPA